MKCPKCGGNTRIIESREVEYLSAVRRRHKCTKCNHRFTSYEYSDVYLAKNAPSILYTGMMSRLIKAKRID